MKKQRRGRGGMPTLCLKDDATCRHGGWWWNTRQDDYRFLSFQLLLLYLGRKTCCDEEETDKRNKRRHFWWKNCLDATRRHTRAYGMRWRRRSKRLFSSLNQPMSCSLDKRVDCVLKLIAVGRNCLLYNFLLNCVWKVFDSKRTQEASLLPLFVVKETRFKSILYNQLDWR